MRSRCDYLQRTMEVDINIIVLTNFIRYGLYGCICYKIYKEAGIYTSLSIFLIALAIEILGYTLINIKYIVMIKKEEK